MSATAKKALNIVSVPTNIITGFLGVGKTTAILHLLRNKPDGERWAVLVNEFGEVGVDGSLIQGQHRSEQGVFISEVAGGCMCCAAGVPMQIALNQLLLKAKPDRLLIEPTGLGHPKEVLAVLSSTHYQDALSLQKTLTLVDARNLADARYTSHDTFNQQLAIADTIIGNKADLYQAGDKERLASYLKERGKAQAKVIFTQHGNIELSALTGENISVSTQQPITAPEHSHSHNHSHSHDHSDRESNTPLAADREIPACGFIKAENTGEGFQSIGWRFASDKVFDRQKLYSFISHLDVVRLKAVCITNEGFYSYNFNGRAENKVSEVAIDACSESRIELIAREFAKGVETKLYECLHTPLC